MVSAVKLNKVIIPLIALLTLQGINLPGAIAASSSAKPKPKVSLVKKVIRIEKRTVVRKHLHHAPVHKAALPSPSPAWPPLGFRSVGTAYARVPTGVELIGILSAMKNSSTATNSCAADPKKPNAPAFSCAAILVGSTQRCNWWKISSTITGIDPVNPPGRISLGDFSDTVSAAAAKTIQTIIMISPIPLAAGVKFTALHALCGTGPATGAIPSSTFIPTAEENPTPSETPSPANT
jgi:hypothetical protein